MRQGPTTSDCSAAVCTQVCAVFAVLPLSEGRPPDVVLMAATMLEALPVMLHHASALTSQSPAVSDRMAALTVTPAPPATGTPLTDCRSSPTTPAAALEPSTTPLLARRL